MADDKLIFPIGFDLEGGVKQAEKDWKSTYQKQLQGALDRKPLKAKIELQTKGLDLEVLKEFNKISKESVKAAQANAKIQKANIQVTERQRIADERVAAAHERTLTATNRRLVAEERLTQVKQRSTRATNEQTNAYKTQSSYLQRLIQRMGVYFGLSQAASFIRNIRDVTMQFELQRVALGAIIGDLNEANVMLEKIKAAAVKSPFQIKELVSYTQMLAAYKIGTDELFETTQRLADISAGLGVSMERLVLAYGQIRATGYLRASEVRQLTEAGIPIVEELAKKMSELRGETVSAAEVMGMISERAISFGMVKEVFDDMTSAGGMFYKMQEKQAETLAGQWSNLQDSIAIMYEEIGNTESVNNSIKGTIGLVKSLAENWRVVGDVAVWSVGAAMGYAKVIKPLSELIQKQRLLNKAKESEIIAEKNLERIRYLNRHKELFADDQEYIQWTDDEIKKLQEYADKHTKIASEARKSATSLKGFGGALKSIGSFIKANWVGMLITAVTALVSWFISARQEANRLNKELAKIGTEGALQADQSVRNFERLARAIRESADGSAKQTEALEEMKRTYGEFLPSQDKSIINLVREKDGYNAVTQAIREKIALQIHEQKLNTIASEYGSRFGKWEGRLKESPFFKYFSKEEISLIISDIKNAVNDGLIATTNDIEDNMNKVRDIIHNITGSFIIQDNLQRLFTGGTLYKGSVTELIKTQEAYNAQIQEVESSMESATGSLGKYTQAYKDFKEELKDVTGTGEKFSFEWNESKTKAEIKAYNEFVGDLLAKEGIRFDIGDAIDFKGLYEALGDNYPQLKQVVAKIQGEYEKLVPKDLEKLIKEQFSTLATKYGASLDKLQHYFKSADQLTQDWVKTLKGAKTEIGNQIFDAKKLDKDTTALEAQKQVIEEMITAWDNSEKTQKAGAKSAEQALKDELSAVEKIYKRYQDLRKLKSETDTQSILAKEFKGVSLTALSKAYSPEQMIEVYEKALAEAQRLGKEDLVLEIQTKIGEFNVAEEQRKLEKSLKDLSDKISRTKTAKEFFDRMLGMTGDREFSASLTLSVYGEGGEDLGKKLAENTIEELETAFEGVDISSAIDKNTGKVDYAKLAPLVEQLPEKAQANAQSLVKAGMKANADWLIDLHNTYQKAFSFDERRTQVMETEAQKQREIMASILPDKDKYLEASRNYLAKQLANINFEEFKASADYVKIFEDIDNLATPTIERLLGKLKEQIDVYKDLDPEKAKTLMNEYQKLYNGLIERNPFKAIADGIKEYSDALKNGDKDAKRSAITKVLKGFEGVENAFSSAANSVNELAKSLGFAENSDTAVFLQGIAKAFGFVATSITLAKVAMDLFDKETKKFLTTNPFGWVLAIGAAVVGVLSAISNAKVRKADKEIKHQQDLIDSLGKSYEKLEKQIEKTFGSDYIENYNDRLANLYAQQEAYLKQAEKERSKGKKEDEEKTKGYLDSASDVAEQIADMHTEVQERMLGTDLASAARDFAQSWIDAYKEFGSTTDAMKEKFHDMIQNMVVESIAGRMMQQLLKPVFDSIDEYSKDGELDEREIATIADLGIGLIDTMDESMTALVERLQAAGYNIRQSTSGLTGISKDIASASEESILGLAAGINTQNFYISQVPPKLDTIIAILQGGGVPSGGGVNMQDLVTLQNQHLSYLPSIAQHTAETVAECKQIVVETRRTADALERVIKPRGMQASHTLNTSL